VADAPYCVLPFTHLRIEPTGSVRPCCRFGGAIPGATASDITSAFASPFMDRLRADMAAGVARPECRKCQGEEAHGIRSMRMIENERHAVPAEPTLTYLEICLSNVCNLKCRMCSSLYSTRWIADEKALGKTPTPLAYSNLNVDAIRWGEIRMLKFLGGEPVLHHEEIGEILRRIDQAGRLGDLTVNFTTNCTVTFPAAVLHMLDRCAKVIICASVDAIGPLNDYIRDGSSFEPMLTNLRTYRDHGRTLVIHTVMSLLNANVLHDIHDAVASEFPSASQMWLRCFAPKELDPANVPDSVRADLLGRLIGLRGDPYLRGTAALKAARTADMATCTAHIRRLDDLRGQRLAAVNPEMAGWLELG
jgi:sulfatase maturation enzyme AslB (radical SAM superfamily)